MRRILAATTFILAGLCAVQATAETCAVRTGTLATNGVSLYWEEHGDAANPPLLLVHGFGESMAAWAAYVPILCARYDVVLIDLRGHGRSTNPTDRWSFTAAADDVTALMAHLHHERFKALGVSAGAFALLHVATRASNGIETLVLVGAAPYFPAQARQRIGDIAADPRALQQFRSVATRGDAQAESLLRQFATLASSVDDPAFTPPQLATITAPTLVVCGDRDEFFPVEMSIELYRSIPNAYLRVYPNGGHVPIYEPAAVADFGAQLAEFFDGRWSQH